MIYQLYSFIQSLITVYTYVLLIYALLSWLPGAYESKLGQIIVRLARPYVSIFERIIPPMGGISFSVVIAMLSLSLVRYGVTFLFNLFL